MVIVDDTIEIESGSEPRMIDVIGNDYVMASGGSKLLASFAEVTEVTEDLAFLSDQPVLMIKSVTEGSPDSPVSCEAMDNEVIIKVTDDSYVGRVSCYYTLVMRDSLGNEEEIVDQQGTINISVTPGCVTTTTTVSCHNLFLKRKRYFMRSTLNQFRPDRQQPQQPRQRLHVRIEVSTLS